MGVMQVGDDLGDFQVFCQKRVGDIVGVVMYYVDNDVGFFCFCVYQNFNVGGVVVDGQGVGFGLQGFIGSLVRVDGDYVVFIGC